MKRMVVIGAKGIIGSEINSLYLIHHNPDFGNRFKIRKEIDYERIVTMAKIPQKEDR